MTGSDLVAIEVGGARELARELRRAGHDLDRAGERARGLLLAADRPSGAPALLEDVAGWSHRSARGLADRVEQVVRLDARAPVVVGAVRDLHLDVRRVDDLDALLLDLVALGVLAGCPPPGDPAGRRAALASLPASLVEGLLAQAPALLGHADGVPVAVRDRANRRLLDREIRRLEELDAPAARDRRLLRDLRAWRDDPTLTLVKLDVARGRVVLGRGEVDTADHLAVVVPGAGLTLHGVSRRHLGWIDDLESAMTAALDGRGSAAAVLWLDYDAPERLVLDAVRREAATDAATRLPAFLDGVGVADRRLVTTIGHSYGSVVLGRSLADRGRRLASDRLVALGSPGLGVQLSRELRLRDDQRLFAATFAEDPIALAGHRAPVTGDVGRMIHGPDPRRLLVTTTVPLPTDGLGAATPLERHMQYLDPGSAALAAVADLAVGGDGREVDVGGGPREAVAGDGPREAVAGGGPREAVAGGGQHPVGVGAAGGRPGAVDAIRGGAGQARPGEASR